MTKKKVKDKRSRAGKRSGQFQSDIIPTEWLTLLYHKIKKDVNSRVRKMGVEIIAKRVLDARQITFQDATKAWEERGRNPDRIEQINVAIIAEAQTAWGRRNGRYSPRETGRKDSPGGKKGLASRYKPYNW